MDPITLYFLVVVGAIIAGILVAVIFFGLVHVFKTKIQTRKIPKKKSEVSKFIKENPQVFDTPGNVKIDEKEVEEDDRREFERFRQFERLRRETLGNGATPGYSNQSAKRVESQGLRDVPQRPINNPGVPDNIIPESPRPPEPVGRAKQEDRPQRKIRRPEFI